MRTWAHVLPFLFLFSRFVFSLNLSSSFLLFPAMESVESPLSFSRIDVRIGAFARVPRTSGDHAWMAMGGDWERQKEMRSWCGSQGWSSYWATEIGGLQSGGRRGVSEGSGAGDELVEEAKEWGDEEEEEVEATR